MQASQLSASRKIGDSHVFDLAMSHRGLRLNRMCHVLNDATGRAAFRADEAAFLARFDLTEAELALVTARDFNGLLAAGINIYYLIKFGVATGNGLYRMGAQMRGETYEQFLVSRNNSGAV